MPAGPVKIDKLQSSSTFAFRNETKNGKFDPIISNIYSEGFHLPVG